MGAVDNGLPIVCTHVNCHSCKYTQCFQQETSFFCWLLPVDQALQ